MQEEIDQILQKYPWATEAQIQTLSELRKDSTILSASLATVLREMAKGPDANKEEMQKSFDKVSKEVEKAFKADTKGLKGLKDDFFETLTSTTKPFSANEAVDTFERNREIKAAAAELSQDMMGSGNKITRGFGKAIGFAGRYLNAGTIGLTALAATVRMILGHGKQLNTFTDMGATSGPEILKTLDQLKRTANSQMGSLDAYMKATSEFNYTFAGLSNNVTEGQMAFQSFLARANFIEKQTGFGDFGKDLDQFAHALAQEADLLNKINGINQLDSMGRLATFNAFKDSRNIIFALAGTFGDQVSALEEERAKRLNDVDALFAFQQSIFNRVDEYGNNEVVNQRNSYDAFLMMLKQIPGLDPGMLDQIDKALLNAIANSRRELQLDELPADVRVVLEQFNTNNSDGLLGIMEDILANPQGGLDTMKQTAKVIKDIRSFISSDAGAGVIDIGPAMSPFRQFAFGMMSIKDSDLTDLMNLTEESFKTINKRVDGFDNAIDAADRIRQMKGDFANAFTVTFRLSEIFARIANFLFGLAESPDFDSAVKKINSQVDSANLEASVKTSKAGDIAVAADGTGIEFKKIDGKMIVSGKTAVDDSLSTSKFTSSNYDSLKNNRKFRVTMSKDGKPIVYEQDIMTSSADVGGGLNSLDKALYDINRMNAVLRKEFEMYNMLADTRRAYGSADADEKVRLNAVYKSLVTQWSELATIISDIDIDSSIQKALNDDTIQLSSSMARQLENNIGKLSNYKHPKLSKLQESLKEYFQKTGGDFNIHDFYTREGMGMDVLLSNASMSGQGSMGKLFTIQAVSQSMNSLQNVSATLGGTVFDINPEAIKDSSYFMDISTSDDDLLPEELKNLNPNQQFALTQQGLDNIDGLIAAYNKHNSLLMQSEDTGYGRKGGAKEVINQNNQTIGRLLMARRTIVEQLKSSTVDVSGYQQQLENLNQLNNSIGIFESFADDNDSNMFGRLFGAGKDMELLKAQLTRYNDMQEDQKEYLENLADPEVQGEERRITKEKLKLVEVQIQEMLESMNKEVERLKIEQGFTGAPEPIAGN